MNPILKALFLGVLNYLVYSYIILPVSSPTLVVFDNIILVIIVLIINSVFIVSTTPTRMS